MLKGESVQAGPHTQRFDHARDARVPQSLLRHPGHRFIGEHGQAYLFALLRHVLALFHGFRRCDGSDTVALPSAVVSPCWFSHHTSRSARYSWSDSRNPGDPGSAPSDITVDVGHGQVNAERPQGRTVTDPIGDQVSYPRDAVNARVVSEGKTEGLGNLVSNQRGFPTLPRACFGVPERRAGVAPPVADEAREAEAGARRGHELHDFFRGQRSPDNRDQRVTDMGVFPIAVVWAPYFFSAVRVFDFPHLVWCQPATWQSPGTCQCRLRPAAVCGAPWRPPGPPRSPS